ncbi:serine/arginine repetitive matrix protein 1 isoform X1 [Punica granatum]|nr:serine/arginine repetitive matrix protein 1 isoform X1 [Punica granatum]
MAEAEPHPPKQDGIRARSSKYSANFLYKASLALIFLVIIPLFPSQAPEFINQTVPNRSWELLHLVLVGIAVSYGLFSSRNQEETEKEANPPPSKFDSAQSCVSRLLQVPSVFDDEPETQSGSGDEVGKLETWSSQYYPNDPVVVLAKEQEPSVIDQQRVNSVGSSSRIGERPLLLPVRSLKSRVLDDEKEPIDELRGVSSKSSLCRSSSDASSKRFSGSNHVTNRMKSSQKLRGSEDLAEDKEAAVLPSPIPWRSRSGRMEVNEEVFNPVSPFSSIEDFEYFRAKPEASKPQISASSRPNSGSKISFSSRKSSLTSESQAKIAEDFVRKKSFQKSSPPPPPPPPPMAFKSSLMKPSLSSGYHLNGVTSDKDFRRSSSTEPKEATQVYSGIEKKPRSTPLPDVGKSVRTLRAQKSEGLEIYGAQDADETLPQNARRRIGMVPKPSSLEFSEEEKDGFVEDVTSESDEESPLSENDEEAEVGTLKNDEVGLIDSVGDGGRDVDKKADEFIAKFREQIRLQRIDSIKRSSAEISRSLSR